MSRSPAAQTAGQSIIANTILAAGGS